MCVEDIKVVFDITFFMVLAWFFVQGAPRECLDVERSDIPQLLSDVSDPNWSFLGI